MYTLEEVLEQGRIIEAEGLSSLRMEVSCQDNITGGMLYHWAAYRANSIKPEDEEWCSSWDELISDIERYGLNADAEIWEHAT